MFEVTYIDVTPDECQLDVMFNPLKNPDIWESAYTIFLEIKIFPNGKSSDVLIDMFSSNPQLGIVSPKSVKAIIPHVRKYEDALSGVNNFNPPLVKRFYKDRIKLTHEIESKFSASQTLDLLISLMNLNCEKIGA